MQLEESKAAELQTLLYADVYIPTVVRKCAEYGYPIENDADLARFAETVASLRQIKNAGVDGGHLPAVPSRYDGIAGLAKQAEERIVGSQISTSALDEWVRKESGATVGDAARAGAYGATAVPRALLNGLVGGVKGAVGGVGRTSLFGGKKKPSAQPPQQSQGAQPSQPAKTPPPSNVG